VNSVIGELASHSSMNWATRLDVAVGTANFYEAQTALQVIAGIHEFMQRHGIQDVREIVGSVQVPA